MRFFALVLLLVTFISCKEDYKRANLISTISVQSILQDSTLGVRALDFDDTYIYYGSSNHYGKLALKEEFKIDVGNIDVNKSKHHFRYKHTNDSSALHFRAIKVINEDMFAISIGNPAKLYRLNRKAEGGKLVYQEEHPKVFYDSMEFWNEKEGLAIGDPTDDCISIIITRDGGKTWTKTSCDDLSKVKEGEAAFAASDTNIAIVGDHTWVATGGVASRVLYSSDKGQSWEAYDTPIVQGKPTTGMYSIDFYDEKNGFAIGGDYTKPNDTLNNKIRTNDGGKTWQVVANGKSPGYRSCVQYIPNSDGKELVAVGFKGIDYSNNSGDSWTHLSDEGFYTLRFLNDSIAYAAGKGRVSKLIFR